MFLLCRLFLTTKLPNPHYSPETCVKVGLLNFFITPSGLEDQLLAKIVGKERKDLEDEKKQLTASNAQMAKDLKELQDTILRYSVLHFVSLPLRMCATGQARPFVV